MRVSLGQDPVTGRWKQLSRIFHGGARVADAALRDLVDQQVPGRVDGAGVTVGQLLDEWLAECNRVDLSPTTIRNYRSQVDNHVRPTLAKVKLARLTAKHLDDLYDALKDAGRSPKSIRNVHAILSSALHQGGPLGMGAGQCRRAGQAAPGSPNAGWRPPRSRWSEK